MNIPSTRAFGAAAIAGLAMLIALLGGPSDRVSTAGGAPTSGTLVLAHRGLPDGAEAGFRSAAPAELRGTIRRDRDAIGPIFVLVEPNGRRLRIAYVNGGAPGLEDTLRDAPADTVYTLRGTVLDWGRGVRSFDMGKPLTITR